MAESVHSNNKPAGNLLPIYYLVFCPCFLHSLPEYTIPLDIFQTTDEVKSITHTGGYGGASYTRYPHFD